MGKKYLEFRKIQFFKQLIYNYDHINDSSCQIKRADYLARLSHRVGNLSSNSNIDPVVALSSS